ncbi:hypothetical protein C8F01DRAFT_1225550 [Mycena amicta]|nr:hypothetical protein C8F01DRAFT_1225550 [Mycena amicta]
MYTTTPHSLLPGFSRLSSGNRYAILHELVLWPTGTQDRLAPYIEAWNPNLWTVGQAMDVDPDESDQPPLAAIRYINLAEHRRLAVDLLQGLDTMIIRQEYVDFLADALQQVQEGKQPRFFLTGQPGVGKWSSSPLPLRSYIVLGYFLLRLLASSQPVFFISDSNDSVSYFSETGVEFVMANNSIMQETDVLTALERSWVIIDVDLGMLDWLPKLWVKSAACVVWTSPPRERRKHHFTKQFDSAVWLMMPWSQEEIAAVTALDKRDHNDVRNRFSVNGPVPRNLFGKNTTTSLSTIDQAIKKALSDGIFSLTISDVAEKASHEMFMIQPVEVLDASGQPSIQRKEVSFNFLSNFIASRTADLMEQHIEKVRRQLIHAFNNPETRSAAGKLVESIMHSVLIQGKTDLPAAFGGGKVAAYLELVGKAENFSLEIRAQGRRDLRPLYLRPLSANFASADAILVTKTHVCLIQTSLSETHSHNVRTLLRILTRLTTNKIPVDSLRLVYCIVGVEHHHVQNLLGEATKTLKLLQDNPNAAKLQNPNEITIKRLKKLEVAGFTLDAQIGVMVEVEA